MPLCTSTPRGLLDCSGGMGHTWGALSLQAMWQAKEHTARDGSGGDPRAPQDKTRDLALRARHPGRTELALWLPNSDEQIIPKETSLFSPQLGGDMQDAPLHSTQQPLLRSGPELLFTNPGLLTPEESRHEQPGPCPCCAHEGQWKSLTLTGVALSDEPHHQGGAVAALCGAGEGLDAELMSLGLEGEGPLA